MRRLIMIRLIWIYTVRHFVLDLQVSSSGNSGCVQMQRLKSLFQKLRVDFTSTTNLPRERIDSRALFHHCSCLQCLHPVYLMILDYEAFHWQSERQTLTSGYRSLNPTEDGTQVNLMTMIMWRGKSHGSLAWVKHLRHLKIYTIS